MCVSGCNHGGSTRGTYQSELTDAAVEAGNNLSDAEANLKKTIESDPENYGKITEAQQQVQRAMQIFAQLQKLLENLHQTVMRAIQSLRAS